MNQRLIWLLSFFLFLVTLSFANDVVPQAAWRRPIGQPLKDPGGKKPEIKDMIDDGYWQGAPVGGFGAGTFSRSYRGEFERWHLKTGVHKYQSVPANQFSVFAKREGDASAYAQVLATDAPANHELSAWKWNYPVGHGEYAALYPKSWFQYKTAEMPVELTVEQFSPILPNNYKETSYPVAIYNWYAVNPGNSKVTVSIMFSWTNMVGWFRGTGHDFRDANNLQNINTFRSEQVSGGTMKGIVFDRLRKNPVQEDWDGQFAIAAMESPGVQVSYLQTFMPSGDGADVWAPFSSSGVLPSSAFHFASGGEPLAGAIAVQFTLAPGEKKKIPMVLSWDFPIVEFGNGRRWLRRYTDFFGNSGTNAWQIARAGLLQQEAWSRSIDAWQAPYVNNSSKPAWYRGMLFNELYYLADGGTFWGHELQSPRAPVADTWKRQTFIYLECFDYPYYSTLDVLFYGSMPVVKFWPLLDKASVREFADTVNQEIPTEYLWIWKSQQETKPVFRERKVKGALPHDLGNPAEDPVILVNQFDWQNTNRWKDLNTKYVLMVWRDFILDEKPDLEFLRYNYSGVKQAMEYLLQFDHDGDGLIENEGYPDQTYDTWVTRGASAYSGGLYLAALRATEEIAHALGDSPTVSQYHSLFEKARATYIKKLWNGNYFNYDSDSPYRDSIMSDQLAGQWYANLTRLGDLVPANMRVSALKKIFEFNVMKFGNGDMGALNGMTADGRVLTDNEQIQEVWVGTTFGLCGEMVAEGLRQEAFATAKGIYDVVYEKKGYWFRTPEAWGTDGMYRASMYMRPAAIWSMEMMTTKEASSASVSAGAQD
ncbi:MAG TPA: non-lysosomal glucosylceramidase [Candidatus Angelobacter sp.]|jgi:non-lysosomal glucosylceramidase|nr:non-lysosomal glucosylceramidase [Candidatus Angelobacter sp.]